MSNILRCTGAQWAGKQERFSAGQTVKLEQLDLELPVGSILECEPATHFVLRFASAGSKGSIYEGVL